MDGILSQHKFLYMSNVVDWKGQVDIIYTDFSKAFNRIRVDHNILMTKLESLGFDQSLLRLRTELPVIPQEVIIF